MEIKSYFAQDANGNLIPAATCSLYLKNTNTLATVYDKNGVLTTNPFYSDGTGLIQFSALAGVYDLKVTANGRTYTITVQCVDIAEQVAEVNASKDAASASATASSNSAAASANSATVAEGHSLSAASSVVIAAASEASAIAAKLDAQTAATFSTSNLDATVIAKDEAVASAAAALASEQSAAVYAAQVAADKIDIRNWYYGPLAADPTTRPDSTAMTEGDEYHNTITNKRRVFNGTAWEDFIGASTADLANSTDPEKGAGMVGWSRSPLSVAVNSVGMFLNSLPVNVWEFTSLITSKPTPNDPSTWDWAPAFLAAAAAASSSGGTVVIPPLPGAAAYKYGGSETFVVDLSRFGVEGLGSVVIDCATFTGANAIRLYSSRTYPSAGYHNNINRFASMAWIGNLTAGRHGLLVGQAGGSSYTGQINIWNCSFAKFDRNIHFTDNAWRVAFYNCGTTDALSYQVYAPAGLVNSGECIEFYHSQLYDGAGDIEIACNNFTLELHGCSILNTTLNVSGSAVKVNLHGGNIENPGAATYFDYINVTGNTCHVVLFGTTLVMNQPSLFTDSPFKVAANSVIDFVGVRIPDGNFALESGALTFSLCSGAGIARGTNCFYPPISGGNDPNMGYPAQSAANGNFESGNLNGWTTVTAGGGGTAAASALSAKNGSYGARLTANSANGSAITLRQTFQVKAGQMVCMGAWGRVNVQATSGNSGSLSFAFLDQAGNSLLTGASNMSTPAGYTLLGRSLTRLAPRGAVTLRVDINALNGAEVDFDDVIVNLL